MRLNSQLLLIANAAEELLLRSTWMQEMHGDMGALNNLRFCGGFMETGDRKLAESGISQSVGVGWAGDTDSLPDNQAPNTARSLCSKPAMLPQSSNAVPITPYTCANNIEMPCPASAEPVNKWNNTRQFMSLHTHYSPPTQQH
jgi:hypothetical protein